MKPGEQPKLQIAMLLYPGLTLLDLIGPQTVFSWFADIHLVWKTKDLVISDTGIGIRPSATFEECPQELDLLMVPEDLVSSNIWPIPRCSRSWQIEAPKQST